MGLNLREVEVFKPYVNEFPEHLLLNEGAEEAVLTAWQEAQILRVAKRGSSLLGAYAMQRQQLAGGGEEFCLLGVVVDPVFRRQGLGRWLTGHAIGVAESKGGRRLCLHSPPGCGGGTRMFTRMGFARPGAASAGEMVFDLIPE